MGAWEKVLVVRDERMRKSCQICIFMFALDTVWKRNLRISYLGRQLPARYATLIFTQSSQSNFPFGTPTSL